jgi:hypothetical protein
MSTKSTIACDNLPWDHPTGWHLYEEMVDDSVWVEVRGGSFQAAQCSVCVQLPPAVIDAIRAAPAAAFPHLRPKECEP